MKHGGIFKNNHCIYHQQDMGRRGFITLGFKQFDDHNKKITEGVNSFLRFPDSRECFTMSFVLRSSLVNQEVTDTTFNVQKIFQHGIGINIGVAIQV